MWDGFDLPGEVLRHQLPAPLDETVGDEPAAIVGNSYGGFVALDFAARRPELVERLVLLDAPLMDHEFSPEFMEYVEEEERLIEAGDMDAAVELNLRFWCPEIADRVRPMVPGSLDYENEELPNPDLAAIRVPTLVGVGELDKPDFRAIAERLARELPNAELLVIEGAGHLPPMERPEETARAVRRFLG
ncbi:MAG TPA: alpha/beta hydrolase [Thermoleophilaceae bacterium]|nr:alpha/beta hydrolase [Thermoleophilaceae bacterium]